LAARLCAQAEPARILVAQLIMDQCQGHELPFSDLREITPKGFDRAIGVYEVNWMNVKTTSDKRSQ
jgi:class 3 adenylate cyclase